MKYRTIESSANVRLRRERRSAVQNNEFPLEDLQGNIVIENRRAPQESEIKGIEVTDIKISKAEFLEYFNKIQNT